MPSDPDNKMDELLKSYAKKRRDEAGDPPEMHPATRRLLQAEIAKLRPEASAPSVPWWQNLVMFWPRLAFATGVFIALGVAAWSLMDSMKQGTAESQLARNDRTLEEQAVPLAEEREVLRDETGRAARPVQLANEADAKSRFENQAELARSAVGGRVDDALLKQKVLDPAQADGAGAADRFSRSVALSAPPAAAQPPAVTKPAALAELESRQFAANTPSQQPARTKAGLAGEFPSKDAANIRPGTAAAEALGKNLVANEEARLGLAPARDPINSQNVNLSFAANNQAAFTSVTNAVVAYAVGVDGRKLDNNSRLPGGVLPPTEGPAGQVVGNTASSLDAFYAANQNKAAGAPQAPKLELSLQDNSGLAFANNREALLRQNTEPQATSVTDRPIAPATQPMPLERKPAEIALTGAKAASDKTVRELDGIARARTDADSYANRGVASDQVVQKGAVYRQRFAQVPLAGQVTFFKKIAPIDTKVLSNFEVQRNGGQVRVVDADGSVYDGQVVADEAVVAGAPAVAADQVRQQVRRSETRQSQTPALQQAATPDTGGPNWAFRVSGTNRTLRQPVSLEGVMQNSPLQNQAAQSPAAGPTAQSPNPAGAPQLPGQSTRQAGRTAATSGAYKEQATSQLSSNVSNLYGAQRMQGRLRVGSTTQVQLEAVPADN